MFLWCIRLVYYIGHPQPPQLNWARVCCGCQPGPTPRGPSPRQGGEGTRAPALHTLDDVLRFRGDEEKRAVLLQRRIHNGPCEAEYIPGRHPADEPSRKYRVTRPNRCFGVGVQRYHAQHSDRDYTDTRSISLFQEALVRSVNLYERTRPLMDILVACGFLFTLSI